MNGKKPRVTETRSATKRPDNFVPPGSMVTNISLGPDWKLRWVRRFMTRSEEDKNAYFKRLRRGWVPVKPEELPELEYMVQEGLLQDSGCILCKRPAEDCAQDVGYYEDQALGALASANSEYMSDNTDSRIQKFSEGGKAKVLRGKAPAY